jgi:putative ABC transport system substrate-binding protein
MNFASVGKYVAMVAAEILLITPMMGPRPASADEAPKVPTIGMAVPVDPETDAPFQKAFRDGLRALGYVDGKNVIVIVRYANGDPTRLQMLVKELISLHVDVLVGDAPVLKAATTTIPIVSPTMGDPVKTGLVASLARPGGNLTGVSAQIYDIWPKQLELARELVPNLKSLCLLFDANDEPNAVTNANTEFRALARDMGIAVRLLPVGSLDDIRVALRTIRKERPQALIVWDSPLMIQHHHAIMDSVAHRLPVMSQGRDIAEAGALLTYSVDWRDMFRRSAAYVDRILKGAKAGDLPIEQPTKFELIVNLKTANALGLKVPESILVRADDIIR